MSARSLERFLTVAAALGRSMCARSVGRACSAGRLCALVALACLGQGCGYESGVDAQNEARPMPTGGETTPNFLDKIPDAPMRVAYSGRRHVLVHYAVAGAPSTLEYDEDVYSDGQGQFSIVPVDVFSPPMTTQQEDFFKILQEQRDGFFYRYRDFRIRDLRLFEQNWSAHDAGLVETVAGRSTAVLDFHRTAGAPTWYRAWIDPRTGLVLRSEERDGSGALVSRVEFVTFTLTPDLSGVVLHGPRFPAAELNLHDDTIPQVGFQVHVPTILPRGYRLEKAESVSDTNGNWSRLAYGDGVEQVFLLQTLDPIGPVDPNETDVGPKSVRVFQVGPWTVLQGRFGQERVIVLGKASETSLLRMLKSAIH